MYMKREDRWHCTNPACGCEVVVNCSESGDRKTPRCSCGALMKKKYVPPTLSYLEFLRLEETPKVAAREE